MDEISVQELKMRLDNGEKLILIDCREPYEFETAHLSELNYPLDNIASFLKDFENQKQSEIIVYCRSGNRSRAMVNYLQQQGFLCAKNLTGGVLAWKTEIEPSFPVA
jgi:rhodanese-related sulfurtransferase